MNDFNATVHENGYEVDEWDRYIYFWESYYYSSKNAAVKELKNIKKHFNGAEIELKEHEWAKRRRYEICVVQWC